MRSTTARSSPLLGSSNLQELSRGFRQTAGVLRARLRRGCFGQAALSPLGRSYVYVRLLFVREAALSEGRKDFMKRKDHALPLLRSDVVLFTFYQLGEKTKHPGSSGAVATQHRTGLTPYRASVAHPAPYQRCS